jgi:hypothetical protein
MCLKQYSTVCHGTIQAQVPYELAVPYCASIALGARDGRHEVQLLFSVTGVSSAFFYLGLGGWGGSAAALGPAVISIPAPTLVVGVFCSRA